MSESWEGKKKRKKRDRGALEVTELTLPRQARKT